MRINPLSVCPTCQNRWLEITIDDHPDSNGEPYQYCEDCGWTMDLAQPKSTARESCEDSPCCGCCGE